MKNKLALDMQVMKSRTTLFGDRRGCFRHMFVVSILLATFVSNWSNAAQDDEKLVVSPIISQPSGEIHNGELVWVDLVTTNPQQAVDFYVKVFDWQPRYFADKNYIELSHDGQVICSVVLYEDDEAVEGDAWWLVSISVPDVDGATRIAAENGGEVLEVPTELPDRGRYSVIKDAQGAVSMLLRATGGDPIDSALIIDEWAWAELWTDDPEDALNFYQAIIGYDTLRIPDGKGGERIVLGTDGRARATVVPLPWDDVEPNWLPYISVANTADTLRRIVDAGGAVMEQTAQSEGSISAAIVVDPTGGVFAIQQVEISQ